ncbi:MAG: hypothetical protein JW966_04590 [Anaerolineae bacterium]|nr:hypothetical protein [Anaerolineae bacterium]
MGKHKRKNQATWDGVTGGIMLIGFGLLFMVDEIDFWPWVLAVIGFATLPSSIAREGFWAGLQGALWMIGLAILFATGAWWPGILILTGLSIIAGALVRPQMISGKRKRTVAESDLDHEMPTD